MMPRPESPEGPWVTIPVRVRKSLQDRIDGVRGGANRSEWFRSLAESAVGDAGQEPPADPGQAEYERQMAAAKRWESPDGAAEPARKSRRRAAAAPRTVTPAAAGVPAAAFQEPVPAKPPRCTHPGTRVIGGFCKTCDVVVGQGGVLPDGWAAPEGWKP